MNFENFKFIKFIFSVLILLVLNNIVYLSLGSAAFLAQLKISRKLYDKSHSEIGPLSFSKNGKWLAGAVDKKGTGWHEIKIWNLDTVLGRLQP